jgi:hypothetical protein
MKHLLKIATILDEYGNYILSDKLFKIAETYVPPVEFYDMVDKRHYNEFKTPGSKNYDEMMSSRYKNMPKNLSNTAIMDGSMYYDNPNTPKDILKLRNQLVPTNFRNELKRYQSGDTMTSSNSAQNFATSLWEFSRKNKLSNSLTESFDAYADAGATYRGKSIKDVPELVELYKIIKNSPRMFNLTEISEMLKDMEGGK